MDRIEIAHARQALGDPAAVLVARSLWGWYGAVPRGAVAAVLAAQDRRARPRWLVLWLWLRLAWGLGRAGAIRAARQPGAVFSIVSHHGLERGRAIERLMRQGAAFVPMVIDIIPLTHPQFHRAAQGPRHARRMLNVARLAKGVIFISETVRHQAQAWLAEQGTRLPPSAVAPMGIDLRASAAVAPGTAPYFLALSTLEPRKNHMLLLEVWRELHARMGSATPRLVFVGRPGWENEPVERFIAAHPEYVEWHGHVPEAELARLLGGARALLFPSFAEGFGVPVAEALAAGVPVIASDLAVLREVGGDVPEYLEPLDGLGWLDAVRDYADPQHPRRAAQLARLAGWRAPGWEAHFAACRNFIEGLAADQTRS
ncbi:glycosyltransferase family 4 protein [Rhodovarius lipocyclicus]|uniref:glycosyltransferase family 4 protein n=1 Tax=Rhodovarius lipocyclicus TaxID=268410 RepID=UPI00135BA061|nr:glycosyltransferase family 1 protein [Rhodovarius lipocyclicus]